MPSLNRIAFYMKQLQDQTVVNARRLLLSVNRVCVYSLMGTFLSLLTYEDPLSPILALSFWLV